jgi:hypothetical protein
MFDDQPVHLAMERIFAPVATAGTAPPAPPRMVEDEPPAPRRWFMGKDGIAAAGFALAVTAVGIVMAPLLSTTPRPAPVPALRTAAPVPAVAPAAPTPAPVAAPAPAAPVRTAPAPAPVSVATAATPSPTAARPRRIVRATRLRATRRHHARAHPPRYQRRGEAPRLYGAALRRALARDVVITRRLNQEALRRLPAR